MWIIWEVLFMGGLVGIDLFSKWAIKAFLETQSGMHYPVWENILEFRYVSNDGASFGLFSGNQTALIVITFITVLAFVGFLFLRPRAPKLLRYGVLTVVGGAIGNLVDRLAFNYVRDFIDYTFLKTWFNIDFAIGNIADIFCLVGLLMLIVYILFGYREGDLSRRPALKRADGKS